MANDLVYNSGKGAGGGGLNIVQGGDLNGLDKIVIDPVILGNGSFTLNAIFNLSANNIITVVSNEDSSINSNHDIAVERAVQNVNTGVLAVVSFVSTSPTLANLSRPDYQLNAEITIHNGTTSIEAMLFSNFGGVQDMFYLKILPDANINSKSVFKDGAGNNFTAGSSFQIIKNF